MEDNTFIKLFRKIEDWEWYQDTPTKSVFLHCLIKANWKRKCWRGIIINKGQFFTSISHLSIDLNLSEKQVRTALKKLNKTGEIKTQGASNGTMITVCKYDSYQVKEKPSGEQKGEQGANEGRTKGERRATTKEGKEIKEDKNKNKGSLFPESKVELNPKKNPKPEFDLSFVSTVYRPLVIEFIRYRKQDIKKPFKTELAVQSFYKHLVKISNNNVVKAKELIQHAKENEWLKPFPIKKEKNAMVFDPKNPLSQPVNKIYKDF